MRTRISTHEQQVLLEAAAAAPSVLNTQPWRFVFDGDEVRVHTDPERQLRQTDPQGREMVISCGAALYNLRLAAAGFGRQAVSRTTLDPDDPTLMATVTLGGPHQPTDEEIVLYGAIPRRHTDRSPFRGERLSAGEVMRLQEAAWAEGAVLSVLARDELTGLLALVSDADQRIRENPAIRAETARWVGGCRDRADGIPSRLLAPPSLEPAAPVRDFTFGAWERTQTPGRFEREPNLALLSTYEDGPASWLRAGQALQRVLLFATVRGLSASFLTQPLESAEIRARLRDPLVWTWHPQMVLRLGYPIDASGSPRRPIDEIRSQDTPAG